MCPECVNSYCSHDRCISPYISHVIGSTYCHVSQYVLPYIAHVVRVAHHMLPMWSCVSAYRAMWSEWLTIYCPCGRVSAYRAMWSECISIPCYVVRVAHHIFPMCPSLSYHILPMWSCVSAYRAMWSECISIPCYVVRVYHHTVLCGQSVSRYVVSIYAVCVLNMSHHMLPMWSWYHHTVLCGRSVSQYVALVHVVLDGQYVSAYIAHVPKVCLIIIVSTVTGCYHMLSVVSWL